MAVAVVDAVIHERTMIWPRNPLPKASNCEVVEWPTLLRGPLYHPGSLSSAYVNVFCMPAQFGCNISSGISYAYDQDLFPFEPTDVLIVMGV